MNVNEQLEKLCMEHFKNRAYVADGIFFESNADAWNNIHPKVLFVLKQPNSDDLLGEDYREYDFDTCVGEQVWRELLGRLYGIMHTDESGFPKYDKATEIKSLKEAFCQYPFAVINIIKDIGNGTTPTADLKKYALQNLEFLQKQLELLRPDIIVCCGSGVFDIVNMAIQPAIPSNGNWLKYNSDRNIIFFDTYHPGKPNSRKVLQEAYDKPLEEYYMFFQEKIES